MSSCPVNHNSTPNPLSSSTCSSDSIKEKLKSSGSCPVSHLNPTNMMPSLTQDKAPGQSVELPIDRTLSSIPKSNEQGKVWEYPSPQQFYNALVRKGWETPEKEVPMIVDIHNFINEECWNQVLYWENKFHCDCKDISLLKFQGRPKDLTPKAMFYTTVMG